MRFNLETLILGIGCALLLCAAVNSISLWEKVAMAANDCTQRIIPDTAVCAGDNVVVNCSCAANIAGRTWTGTATSGSANGGTTRIDQVSVLCYTVSPCVVVEERQMLRCSAGFNPDCILHDPFLSSNCILRQVTASPTELKTYDTVDIGCKE